MDNEEELRADEREDGGEGVKKLSEWGSFCWVVPVVILSILTVVYVDRKL